MMIGGAEGDDDARFERRKVKSLERARDKFLPSNLAPGEARSGVLRDRMRAVGASCTDVDPMEIDRSVKFDSVGGLAHHIQALKEMVIFPMVYPEVFEKFKLQPPRGVIFYGEPGTGKTLVARALANECSKGDKKVSFFMRKGADCLSKWVGESERQLRLLFDQAYTMRPSIIFFDELDGIAPVRSSRQDQIHSSIVSTLLALMDGLDGRGEIVIIGATNRLDALDPALRRPGRFDRELRFSLPDRSARRDILNIATKGWEPPLEPDLLERLAERTVGYCGADLKGICTEAALVSLRHRYPQIYMSEEKLVLDVERIRVTDQDFDVALRKLTPASRRNLDVQTRPLTASLEPLLGRAYQSLVDDFVPSGYLPEKESGVGAGIASVLSALQQRKAIAGGRVLIAAESGAFGQTSHLAPALLHAMDHLQVHSLAIPTIYAESSSRSPEEAVAGVLKAAARAASSGPTIVFLPAVEEWRRVVPVTVWHTLTAALDSWDALTSILFLVTAHESGSELEPEIRGLFRRSEILELSLPSAEQRRAFFAPLILQEATKEPVLEEKISYPELEIVPRTTEEEKLRKLSDAELKALRKVEEATFRQLRAFLRDVLSRLIRDKRFVIFAKPVDLEEAPDYYQIIEMPMDLGQMMEKIDIHAYHSLADFLVDIDLITSNALEYNPDVELHRLSKDTANGNRNLNAALKDKSIRHRACALRDAAYAILDEDLDPEFERRLTEVLEGMKRRGEDPAPPPSFIAAHSRGRNKGQEMVMVWTPSSSVVSQKCWKG